MLSNVFFDLDGTLVDPREGITKCFQYAFEKLGLPYPLDLQPDDFIGPSLRITFNKLFGSEDKSLIEKAVGLYRERYSEIGIFENTVYPGIPDLLCALHQNSLRLCVVTTKPKIFADRIIRHFHFSRWFSDVFGTELDGRFGNKTEHIKFILSQSDLVQGETIMIGDREFDIAAGKMSGTRTIGVTYGYGSKQEILEAHPDVICASPSEIQRLLTRNNIKF